ncbi:MAG: DMT family transporter [Planctomycetia bacterium]
MQAAHESRPESERTRAFMALAGVQLFFGLFPVFGKLAFEAFAPGSVAVWRIAVGALVLGGVAFLMHGRKLVPPRAELPLIALASFLGIALNMVMYLEGLARTNATTATLLMGLIPVFTFVVALVAGQESFDLLRALGVLVALSGATALRWAESEGGFAIDWIGLLLLAGNALSYATYFVLTRPLARRHPPLCVIAWMFAFSLPAALLLAGRVELLPRASSTQWWSLAFILVFPTVLAYLFNVYALARVSASTTAVGIYAQPFVAALAGWWLLGDRPTQGMLVAAALVFAGLALVLRRPVAGRA